MPNRRKPSFRKHRERLIQRGIIKNLERGEKPRKIKNTPTKTVQNIEVNTEEKTEA